MSSSVIPATTPVSWTAVPDGSAASPSFAFQNSSGTGFYRVSANVLGISTAGVQRVVVDASGNVGVGATPSAWSNTIKAVEFSGGASFSGDSSAVALCTSNAYYDGTNWKYKNTASAGNYYIAGNSHIWRIAASGTAGNNITWTDVGSISTSGAWTLGPSSGLTSAHLIRNSISNGNSVCDFRTSNLYSTITIGGASTYMVAGVTSAGLNMISGTSGAVYQGNNSSAWSTTSDARIKTNIRPISEGLEKVKALKPCHFEYKNNLNKVKTGFIAQEFETVFPGHVTTTEVTEESELAQYLPDLKLKSIDADMIPYLVKAIQELSAKVDAQAAEIEALKAK